MNKKSDRWDSLLEQDWSAAWESLPEAPPLVVPPGGGKTAQMTLRLSELLLSRIKRVAAAQQLPYHPLMRSWILDDLRNSTTPNVDVAASEQQTEQVNVKLDPETLRLIKERAHELRRPYHVLAREWIDVGVTATEESLGLDPTPEASLRY